MGDPNCSYCQQPRGVGAKLLTVDLGDNVTVMIDDEGMTLDGDEAEFDLTHAQYAALQRAVWQWHQQQHEEADDA